MLNQLRAWLPSAAALLLAAGCGGAREAPDVVLHHGKIFTADSARPWAEALAIRGERLVAVGSTDEILRLAAPTTRSVDLGGKAVVPGFNDAHDHTGPPPRGITFATSSDPLPEPAFRQVLDSVRAIASRVPPGTWIGTDVGERVLGDPAARRAALDRAAPRHLVRIQAWTGHGMILNSAALSALGVADSVKDPLGGRFERDRDGRPTGLLEEYAAWGLWHRMSARPDSELVAAFTARADAAVGFGITSIQTMAGSFEPATLRRILPQLHLPIRLRVIPMPVTTPSGRDLRGWSELSAPAGSRIQVSGVKWILDGTPVERLAVLRAPYSDRPGWYGRLNFPPDTVRVLLEEALRAGEQPSLHAVGDSAIGLAFSTMAALAPDSVWRRLRPRIEHGEGVAPDLMPLAKRLGVIVAQNPTHLGLGAVAAARYGDDRLAILQPLRTLLASGIPVALGSDGPINPFLNIMLAAMHPNNPREALTVEQAVRSYTYGSAYAEFAEREKGRLLPGMLADLAVLSQDIFAVSLPQLPRTTSVLTLVGGRPIHDPNGWLRLP